VRNFARHTNSRDKTAWLLLLLLLLVVVRV